MAEPGSEEVAVQTAVSDSACCDLEKVEWMYNWTTIYYRVETL